MDGLFGVGGGIASRRVEIGVGEAVVHGLQAGGGAVGEVGDLQGCRLAGEDEEAAALHEHGKVHEDVDGVRANEGGDLIVADAFDGVPVIRVSPDVGGECVGRFDVAVAKDLDGGVVVGGHERLKKAADGVIAEIRGDVTDTEATCGIGCVGEFLRDEQRGGVEAIPEAMGGENVGPREVGGEVHDVGEVAPRVA